MTATVHIRIPMPLRSYTAGADEVQVEADTVGAALSALGAMHEGVLQRVLSPQGDLRQFVNLYLGNRNVRTLDGLSTRLTTGDIISIVPAVAGGHHEG